jgi:hypothetical protein
MQKIGWKKIHNKDLLEIQGQNSDGSSPTEVLERMRNLIVELQIFKSDNEKLKKAQQEQQDINEVLLRSIVTKKNPKDNNNDEEVNKSASKNSRPEPKKEIVCLKEHLQLRMKQKLTEKENK